MTVIPIMNLNKLLTTAVSGDVLRLWRGKCCSFKSEIFLRKNELIPLLPVLTSSSGVLMQWWHLIKENTAASLVCFKCKNKWLQGYEDITVGAWSNQCNDLNFSYSTIGSLQTSIQMTVALVGRRSLNKLLFILDNADHALHGWKQPIFPTSCHYTSTVVCIILLFLFFWVILLYIYKICGYSVTSWEK